jgi:hypothetical protein
VAYNVLAIRSTKDPDDELYPVIGDGGKTVTMHTGLDGTDRPHFIAVDLSVWELQEDRKYHRLGHFGGAKHTIFVTDNRVVVLSPNFKKADASYVIFDMPGFYLASAVSAALRTHNRALTGQVLHKHVSRLAVIGTGRLKEANRIRLYLRDETEGSEREIYFQITFKIGTDPRPIAQLLARRIAKFWLNPTIARSMDAERTAELRKLSEAPLLAPTGDEWKSYQFPFSVGVARKEQPQNIHKWPAVTQTERLSGCGDTCRPTFRWLDFSQGTPVVPVEWGIRFTHSRSIMPVEEGAGVLVGSCKARGMYLAKRSTHEPVLADGQRRPLYGGSGMYVVTGEHLIMYLMDGMTLVGTVNVNDQAGRLLVATPLREIASIGLTSLAIQGGTIVDKGSPSGIVLIPRDRNWGATWITHGKALVKGDEGSKLQPISLPELEETLVDAVAGALGVATPPPRKVPSGHLYDLAGDCGPAASDGMDGSDSNTSATCSSCQMGKGPHGYPCLACGGTLEA